MNLFIEENTDGLSRCEATFGNWGAVDNDVGYLYFDRSVLDFGKAFSIKMGDRQTAGKVFDGRVMGIEGRFANTRPPEITVLAEDRLQDLRMTRRTRTFEDMSDREVIETLASQHSLRSEINIEGPARHKVIAQVNQSDLAFLRERARTIDAEVWVEDETLFVEARGRRNRGDVILTYGQGLHEFSVLADLSCQRTSLSVCGWNVAVKEGIEHEASTSVISGELNGDTSGIDILQEFLGNRKELIVDTVPFNDADAKYMSEAQLRRKARRFVTGSGAAEGDGRIRAGTYLSLQGLGPVFNGKYYVVEARHTFDGENGYRTYFRVERPGIGD